MSAVQHPVHSDTFFYTDTIVHKAINSFQISINIYRYCNNSKQSKYKEKKKTTTKSPQIVYSPKLMLFSLATAMLYFFHE